MINIGILANLKAAEKIGTSLEATRNFVEIRDIPRMIAAINEIGRRMTAIVGTMLSFARKSEVKISIHNIEELIDKTQKLTVHSYDLKNHYDFKLIEIKKSKREAKYYQRISNG